MNYLRTNIPDVTVIEPKNLYDKRRYFVETFRQDEFEKFLEYKVLFCQNNESKSNRGVLRDLHYQLKPMAQAKLVRVIQGNVLDIALYMRKGSSTIFTYKVDNYYSPIHETSILYNDSTSGINWELKTSAIKLSSKDAMQPLFKDTQL